MLLLPVLLLSCLSCGVVPCTAIHLGPLMGKKGVKQNLHPGGAYKTKSTSLSQAATQKRTDKEDWCQRETPYGPVIQIHDLGPKVGEQQFAHPFSLLWTLCAHSEHFFDFLTNNFASGTPQAHPNGSAIASGLAAGGHTRQYGRICIYADETTPGNVHRPDKGRQYMAAYWTFLDFPSWFRSF